MSSISLFAGSSRAIEALGAGLLRHAANKRLRAALSGGELAAEALYEELLRLIYRLIFLFVAEDRGVLLDAGAPEGARKRYERLYSVGRLRALSVDVPRGDRARSDALWRDLRLRMAELPHGSPALGLPALGSFLWTPEALPWLLDMECADEDLLSAIRALCFSENGERESARPSAVSFRDMGAEELDRLYESLLELHARIDLDASRLTLDTAAGHDRKTTGSYYTPPSLIDSLLESALDPALDEAATSPEPEAAILRLKVCDPACGSGRFLVAAARRIASRLALVRRGGGEVSSDDRERALRDVVGRCLYGVDVSPMAVELCKIALWLEAIEPGPPLRFLSDRIRHGNALLGATPALLEGGVPDEAYRRPVEGDDKAALRRLRQRNRRAKASPRPVAPPRGRSASAGDTLFLWNAWCAAFFWPAQPGPFEDGAVTDEAWRRIALDPSKAPAITRSTVEDLARRYAFFQWHLAFPEVFGDGEGGGGFDVILGNPPWERITVSDEEWFARRDVAIAGIKGKPGRDRAIGALSQRDPALLAAYKRAKRDEELLARFLSRAAGTFPLTGFKELNTYHLFAELAERLVAKGGRVGLIVKTGIGSAESCLPLWRKLCAERRLVSLFDFVNRKPLFPGVQSVERFSLITFTGASAKESQEGSPRPIRFAALCRDTQDMAQPGRTYTLSPEDIALMSPKNGACPLLRGERDAEIMRRLYRSFRVLGEIDPARPSDLWNVEHASIFHMSEDGSSFRRLEELLSAGARPIGLRRFALAGEEYWPLYEGKFIHLLDHRYGSFEDVPAAKRYGRKAEAPAPPLAALLDPAYEITPRYWFPKSAWIARAAQRGLRRDIHFLYRDITGVYPDLRTAIGAIAPAGPAGNSSPCLTVRGGASGVGAGPDRESAARLLAFAALFCSIPFDYVVRNRLFSKHINPNVLGQLVMPPPRAAVPEEGERGTLRARLCDAALELSYTSESLRPLGECMGAARPFAWDPERRFARMREIDAIAAHLYGLSRGDLGHVLGSFETLARAETKVCGEYRTQTAVLRHYDRIVAQFSYGGGAP